jgi:hypothetical protein
MYCMEVVCWCSLSWVLLWDYKVFKVAVRPDLWKGHPRCIALTRFVVYLGAIIGDCNGPAIRGGRMYCMEVVCWCSLSWVLLSTCSGDCYAKECYLIC